MTRQTKKFLAPLVLAAVTLLLCAVVCVDGRVFASETDWLHQHSVFPDYFRKQFYETGELFPEFALSLGGGQNIYNFAYYGLYSPTVLFSCLLPFVNMSDYLMGASVAMLAASVLLFHRWLRKRGFPEDNAFLTALIFLLAGPMIFHSYCQVMFVNYMPWLCLALMGVDRYFEEGKRGLLAVGTFLMILQSFYFSVCGILVLVLYGVSRYLERCETSNERNASFRRVTVFGFLREGIRFLLPILTAVLMSAVLLVPTALALLGGRGNSAETDLWRFFIPDSNPFRYVYSPYGLGLTTLAVTVLITGVTYKKPHERFLHIATLVLLSVPVFSWLLNGCLYERAKALIPFLPLLCEMLASYTEKRRRVEISRAACIWPFVLTVLLFLIPGRYSTDHSDYKTYRLLVPVEAAGMLALSVLAWRKKRPRLLLTVSAALLLVVGLAMHFTRDKLVERTFYDEVTDPAIGDVIGETLSKEPGFYRMEQSEANGATGVNLNRVWRTDQYLSSLYSSTYSEAYQAFRDEFGLDQPYRNILMQGAALNPVLQELMGVKYIVSREDVPGYERIRTADGVSVCQRNDVLPIAYATSRVISEEAFRTLEFPYNQAALASYAVVNVPSDGETFDTSSMLTALDVTLPESDALTPVEGGVRVQTEEAVTLTVPLPELGDADTLFLRFRVENNHPKKDFSVRLENVKNKLTSTSSIYYNENEIFHFAVPLEAGQRTVELTFDPGDCVLTEFSWHAGRLRGASETLLEAEFVPDRAATKGNRVAGTVNASRDGWLVTSIPFDSRFEATVDGEAVPLERVNTAFVGVRLPAGEHRVELVCHAPGLRLGMALSGLGFALFAAEEVVQRRKKRS